MQNKRMSIVNIYIHLVFSTKKRAPLLTKSIRKEVLMHIKMNAQKWGVEIDYANGYYDHIHCLLKLPSTMNMADTAQVIKGESSRWINMLELTPTYFQWQDDYFAESIAERDLERVRNYIKNQEEHHKDLAFEREMEMLSKL